MPVAPPYFPRSFLELVRRDDPAAAPHTGTDGERNPFVGKKILVLSGAADTVVPWAASEKFVGELEVGAGGVKEAIVEEGVGHTCSPQMVKEAVRFLWEHALTK